MLTTQPAHLAKIWGCGSDDLLTTASHQSVEYRRDSSSERSSYSCFISNDSASPPKSHKSQIE